MKIIVFIAGVIVGYIVADNATTEQRSKLNAARRRVQGGRAGAVIGNVGSGVGDIADAAAGRVNDVVDTATSNVADLIASDTSSSTN